MLYSIKAVSQATGLTVQTLRAWERRYRVIEPRRDLSGHRIYTATDVARLRRLRETTERGHPIGKIAQLSDDDLGFLTADHADSGLGVCAAQICITRILRAIEQYQPQECDQAVAMAFALLPMGAAIHEVLSPTLREVGDRWHRGEFTIAQERIVSSAVRRQLSSLLNTYNNNARNAAVVFATVSGEQHELGILMYAALAASHKLRVFYMGPDLPPKEIADYAQRVAATAVAIGMVMPEDITDALGQLAALRKCLAANIQIWIGGAASCGVDPAKFPAGSIQMSGQLDLAHWVDLWAASGR